MDLLPPLEIDGEEVEGKELKSVGNKSLSSLTIVDGCNDDPFLNVDFCSFKLQCLLGRGSYSDVWKAECKEVTVALKVINSTDDVLRGIFYHEVEVMRNLVHPNVVEIMGACVCPVYAIAMEYMTCGSLDQLLHESKNISYKADHAFRWASQCVDALAYIHRKGFAHGDLKTANLLLDDNCHWLKVADFGTMVYMNSDTEYRQGSAPWMAPEIITGSSPSEQSDIYSFGIVLWEIITRMRPYSDCKNAEEILWSVYAGLRPPRIGNIPTKLMQMIERCWQKLPEERPSIKEIQKVLKILCKMYPNFSEPLVYFETNSKQTEEATENGVGSVECSIIERETVTKTDLELSPNSVEEIEILSKKYGLSYCYDKLDK
ncbi:TKL/MLK/TAK1 protein kinase [Loa loa]|uniref:TKL/MLK/TAK1 protein kinase n=1 Tax=Loa loa TaxID=7209 RepID=A0A1I7VGF9_LOALO|nr:TKL/MLK/TAK1 protein kinase [Loa loa]EFO25978.1 TKL/MLK/TAK1 protein kinase [Loa loa]